MSNWNNPTNSTDYTLVLSELKETIERSAKMMDGTDTDSNIPVGSIKWSVAENKFQKYDGSGWPDLSTSYDINVRNLGGQIAEYYLQAKNILTTGGPLPSGVITNSNHGNLGGDTLHVVASVSTAGFMSAVDKAELDRVKALANNSATESVRDDEVEAAYNRKVTVATPGDITTTTIKRFSPANIGATITSRLNAGINSVIFNGVFDKGSNNVNFDVSQGQYQKSTYTAPTTITFIAKAGKAYTMYLYLNTNGNLITLPTGKWSAGAALQVTTGNCLLTVNYDGSGYYYMLLSDMR